MIRNFLRKRAAEKSHIAKLGIDGKNFLPQIRSKKEGELVSIKVNGYKNQIFLRNKTSDIPTFYQCIFNQEYNIKIDFEPKVILDLGANIGLTTFFFKSKYPNAKIIAIEPETGNFELLKKNAQGLNDIVLYKAGVWNRKTNLIIDKIDSGHYGYTVKEVDQPTNNSLPSLGIVDIMTEQKIKMIDVLKIDIEGSELVLFDSTADLWLPNVRVMIIELHDQIKPGCAQAFFKALYKYQFRFELKGENLVIFFDFPIERVV